MRIKLLRAVKAHILEEPKRYNQDSVISSVAEYPGHASEYPACGTKACIGGWALVLSGVKPEEVARLQNPIALDARLLLGLTKDQTERLMATHYSWPRPFARAYSCCRTAAGRAKVAARRIDRFIKTKGAE